MGFDNPVHLAIAAVIILLVLGPKRLPSAARAAGRGIREFRKASNEITEEVKSQINEKESPGTATSATDRADHAAGTEKS